MKFGAVVRTVSAVAAIAFLAGPLALAGETPKVKKDREVVVIRDGELLRLGGDDGPFVALLGGGYLGVGLTDLTPELRAHFGAPKTAGVMVSRVNADSPAGKAGLKAGDIITAVDGDAAESSSDIGSAVRRKKEGEQVKIELLRDRTPMTLFATVAEREPLQMPVIDPEMQRKIEAQTGEAMKKMQVYFDSPEWKQKVEKLQDCGRVQERIRELETRLEELEKKLQSK